jgi:DNA-binding beta-propeller fold protein YncE
VPATLTGFFVNGDGTLNLLSGTPYADPSLSQPTGVVVDPTGTNLYVANQGTGTISQFEISSVDGSLGIGVPVATESITSGPLYLQLAD